MTQIRFVLLFFYYMDAEKRLSRFLHRHSPLSDLERAARLAWLVEAICASRPLWSGRAQKMRLTHTVYHVPKLCERHLKKNVHATCLSLANPGFFERYPSYTRAVRTRGVFLHKRNSTYIEDPLELFGFSFYPFTS